MLDYVELKLNGVKVITINEYADNRGHFQQLYSEKDFAEIGINDVFVQDNQSFSIKAGTLRGLHAQARPHAQAKLVQCTKGKIFDVVVDARSESEQFGHWCGIELSEEKCELLFVPAGFLHGFLTLVDNTEVKYKVSSAYDVKSEITVKYNDENLNIHWPSVPNLDEYIVSEKDDLGEPFNLVADRIDTEPIGI